MRLYERTQRFIAADPTLRATQGFMLQGDQIRSDATSLQASLSRYRKQIIDDIQHNHVNIESMTVFLNIVQESQELLGSLRHAVRGINRLLNTPA